jgi:hypothetical protein
MTGSGALQPMAESWLYGQRCPMTAVDQMYQDWLGRRLRAAVDPAPSKFYLLCLNAGPNERRTSNECHDPISPLRAAAPFPVVLGKPAPGGVLAQPGELL